MRNRINPLARSVLAAAVVAIMVGATATAFADDDQGHHGYYGYGEDHDWHEHHERPPAYYYQPGYIYEPPPVVYAPPPPQYPPPVDLFFSIGIH